MASKLGKKFPWRGIGLIALALVAIVAISSCSFGPPAPTSGFFVENDTSTATKIGVAFGGTEYQTTVAGNSTDELTMSYYGPATAKAYAADGTTVAHSQSVYISSFNYDMVTLVWNGSTFSTK